MEVRLIALGLCLHHLIATTVMFRIKLQSHLIGFLNKTLHFFPHNAKF